MDCMALQVLSLELGWAGNSAWMHRKAVDTCRHRLSDHSHENGGSSSSRSVATLHDEGFHNRRHQGRRHGTTVVRRGHAGRKNVRLNASCEKRIVEKMISIQKKIREIKAEHSLSSRLIERGQPGGSGLAQGRRKLATVSRWGGRIFYMF